MRRAISVSVLALSVCLVSSCVTTVDHISASGRVKDVTTEDIRAAIAADIRAHPALSTVGPQHIEVINENEIHLYWHERNVYGGSDVIKRVRGKWKYYGQIIVTA
jgi:hypothetical protein